MVRRSFRRELMIFLEEIGAGEDRKMDCRTESIQTIEKCVRTLGLDRIVGLYLTTTFGVERLDQLDDADLQRAFRFISALQDEAGPRQLMPIQPGMSASGEACWFRGDMQWNRG